MQNNNFDLLSVGDATLDCFITPSESETLCSIDDKQCLIAFSYGDKIPVKHLDFSLGGNAANNAVGTNRLGIKSSLVLTLGDDITGSQIVEKLDKEGVDMTFVIQQTATTSNYSLVVSYSGERTIFVYHAPRSYEFPVGMPAAPWVYLTSMGQSYLPFYTHFIDWMNKHRDVRIAYNPGTWQLRAGREANMDIFSRSEMLYVNRQEAEKITDAKDTIGHEKELLLAVAKLGPKIAIITDGEKGAFAYDGTSCFKVGVMPVDAYERTGAGDAFGSGCLSALIKGRSLPEALIWGTVNSASVIGYTGAQRGLLTQQGMDEWLARAKSSGVSVTEF